MQIRAPRLTSQYPAVVRDSFQKGDRRHFLCFYMLVQVVSRLPVKRRHQAKVHHAARHSTASTTDLCLGGWACGAARRGAAEGEGAARTRDGGRWHGGGAAGSGRHSPSPRRPRAGQSALGLAGERAILPLLLRATATMRKLAFLGSTVRRLGRCVAAFCVRFALAGTAAPPRSATRGVRFVIASLAAMRKLAF